MHYALPIILHFILHIADMGPYMPLSTVYTVYLQNTALSHQAEALGRERVWVDGFMWLEECSCGAGTVALWVE